MRLSLIAAAFAVALVVAPPSSAAEPPVRFMPVAEVKPGMKGVGRTVFEGSRLDEFQVEIIGVLQNVGPLQSMILARLEGGPLARTGVIAGMSGSPIFIDGRLVGAVAYGFPFSKETIAGITPIQEMLDATKLAGPRAASARVTPVFGPGGPQMPLDPAALMSALKRPLHTIPTDSVHGQGPMGAASLAPLSLPLVFSGFEPATVEWARGAFAGLGLTPVTGGTAGSAVPKDLPDLVPGSPVGISLIEGDLDLSVTGTVTWVDGDRVYAFGHPFYNLGPTQFPLKKAWVYSVFPSLYQSWKISSPGELVGTMDQDRLTAISGLVGPKPRMIPVEVRVETSRGEKRSYDLRMVDDELFTPVLSFMTVASVLQNTERAFGASSMQIDATLTLAGGRTVRVEDLYTEQQPATQAAALVAAPVAYLMGNDFERPRIEKLQIGIRSHEATQSAVIQRAWLDRDEPLRAGATVPLKVLLRTHRGEERTISIPVPLPPNARPGQYSLVIADAATMTALEQREMRQPFVPRDFDHLVKAINELRRRSHLYARLMRNDDGAIVRGEYMQSLPPSVLSVLGGSDQGTAVTALRTAAVWEHDRPMDLAVSGSRVITLTVEP